MSDLIIKPSGTSANFKVQNPSGTDKIVMNSSGTITTGTLGSGVTFPAGMVISHQIKQNLAAGSSSTSTSFAEISSNLRITVTPKNSSSTLVFRVGLMGATSNNSDLEIKVYHDNADGNAPDTFFGDSVTGYAGLRMGQAANELFGTTITFMIAPANMFTNTRIVSPFFRSSNGNAVKFGNSAYNGQTFEEQI